MTWPPEPYQTGADLHALDGPRRARLAYDEMLDREERKGALREARRLSRALANLPAWASDDERDHLELRIHGLAEEAVGR